MAAVAAELGLADFDPAWVGASLVISGLPDFTQYPPLIPLQAEGGATLTVDMENLPCIERPRRSRPRARAMARPSRRPRKAGAWRDGLGRTGRGAAGRATDQAARPRPAALGALTGPRNFRSETGFRAKGDFRHEHVGIACRPTAPRARTRASEGAKEPDPWP